MYKIIVDDKVVGLTRNPKFVRFLPTGHIALTDISSAHGFVGDDRTIYSFTQIPGKNYTVASLIRLYSETEFNRLNGLLNSGNTPYADESALTKARREKLASLSNICKNKIVAGFSIELSDGKQSFKLTTEDQLNLIQIENQLSCGESYFVYHATNQPCKLFTREDMTKVVRAFRKHVLYHTTYYNAVKQYINSLTDLEKINLFSYGDDVSDTIEDIVLRQIVKNGGNYPQ